MFTKYAKIATITWDCIFLCNCSLKSAKKENNKQHSTPRWLVFALLNHPFRQINPLSLSICNYFGAPCLTPRTGCLTDWGNSCAGCTPNPRPAVEKLFVPRPQTMLIVTTCKSEIKSWFCKKYLYISIFSRELNLWPAQNGELIRKLADLQSCMMTINRTYGDLLWRRYLVLTPDWSDSAIILGVPWLCCSLLQDVKKVSKSILSPLVERSFLQLSHY